MAEHLGHREIVIITPFVQQMFRMHIGQAIRPWWVFFHNVTDSSVARPLSLSRLLLLFVLLSYSPLWCLRYYCSEKRLSLWIANRCGVSVDKAMIFCPQVTLGLIYVTYFHAELDIKNILVFF